MSELGKILIETLEAVNQEELVMLEPSPNIADLRKRLHLSQTKFGEIYHINTETIKKWEQKKRNPDLISRAYLKCIEKAPDLIRQLVNS